MREIKFRAYSKDHGFLGDVYEIDFAYGLVKVQRDGLETTHTLGIANVELLQLTGLKDCKGVEIYEGDIVYISGTGNCTVNICPILGTAFRSIDDDFSVESAHDLVMEGDIGEIVGNIHENPDLINQTNGT